MMLPWPEGPLDPGRPPGAVHALLYNRPADTLVAVIARGSPPGPPLHRIYARRLPAAAYRPIGVRHELESQQDARCCERAPLLIFNEFRFREPSPIPAYLKATLRGRELPHDSWGADWLGVRRLDLETGAEARVLDEGSLHPPAPYTSGWVSEILSVTADGSGAVCTVGLTPGGGMDYYVFEVALPGGLRRMVAKLPDVFL